MAGIAVISDIFDDKIECFPGFEIDHDRSNETQTTFVNRGSSNKTFDEITFDHGKIVVVEIANEWYGMVLKQDIVDLFPEEKELYKLEGSND